MRRLELDDSRASVSGRKVGIARVVRARRTGSVRDQVRKLGGRTAAALRNGKLRPSPALAMCLPLLSLEIPRCPQDWLQNLWDK